MVSHTAIDAAAVSNEYLYLYTYAWIIFVFSIVIKLKALLVNHKNIWNNQEKGEFNWINKLFFGGISDFAQVWNSYEVHNIENLINNSRNSVLVGYHSRCTLDLLYLVSYIRPKIMTHHLLFKIPLLDYVLSSLEFISSKDNANDKAENTFVDAVANGNKPFLLLPG